MKQPDDSDREEFDALVEDYCEAGFSTEQANLLAHRVIYPRKPWRREIIWAGALAIAVAAGIGILSLINNGHRIEDNGAAIEQIQQSREDAILSTCEDTNMRHDNTVKALRALNDDQLSPAEVEIALVQAGFTPAQADAINSLRGDPKKNLQGTILLINALAPKHDCAQRVKELTK
jgi:hypothetical protein